MKKLVFMALAAVFMVSSGFANNADISEEDFLCQCTCVEININHYTGQVEIYTFYTNGPQACEYLTLGSGFYDDEDCQDSAGMLNAGQNIQAFTDAESGKGC